MPYALPANRPMHGARAEPVAEEADQRGEGRRDDPAEVVAETPPGAPCRCRIQLGEERTETCRAAGRPAARRTRTSTARPTPPGGPGAARLPRDGQLLPAGRPWQGAGTPPRGGCHRSPDTGGGTRPARGGGRVRYPPQSDRPPGAPLGERLWQRLAHELAARALHLEVQTQQLQWAELEPWLLPRPGAVAVDHLGLPTAPSLTYPGSAALSRLLAAPHVWVKASAPCRSAPRAATAMLRGLLSVGGGERMLWGSDWPWTATRKAGPTARP